MMKRAVTQASRAAVRVARKNNALLASPRISGTPVLQGVSAKRNMATEANSGSVGKVGGYSRLSIMLCILKCHAIRQLLTLHRSEPLLVPL